MAINGNSSSLFNKMLEEMRDSNHVFHLTGSVEWGNSTVHSDIDFFVQSSDEVTRWLSTRGFTAVRSVYYEDSFVDCVYRLHATRLNKQIDVQLVRNFEHKLRIQNKLKALYPSGFGSKAEAAKAWYIAQSVTDPD